MAEPTTYTIKGKPYRVLPLVWRQGQWLAEYVFKGHDLLLMDEAQLSALMQTAAPLLLGISLVEEGQTSEAKARAGWPAAAELAEDLACSLSPAQLKEMSRDFFTVNPFENLWQLIDIPAWAARQKRHSTGLPEVSASSPPAVLEPTPVT